jgi:hypothetical protein
VYPEYRRCVKDGDKIADQSIKEHQELVSQHTAEHQYKAHEFNLILIDILCCYISIYFYMD